MSEPGGHPPDDAKLTAFLDGELPGDERAAVQRWLDRDAAARDRLALLAGGARPFRQTFDLLLERAPRARLEAMLATPGRRSPARGRRRWRMALAAAAVIAAFAVGLTAGRLPLLWPASPQHVTQAETAENWRQAVAEYFSLNTADSLAAIPDDEAARTRELGAVATKLNLPITPARVAFAGLTFKRADMFSFDGHALAEMLYLDPRHGPVALCIIANGQPEGPIRVEQREGLNIAFWQRGGHGFLLIGRTPPGELQRRAETVASRFAS